jgi:hypothetical protein
MVHQPQRLLKLTSLSVASVPRPLIGCMNMVVTRVLLPRSLGESNSARSVHSSIVTNISPKSKMIGRLVRKSKATELIVCPGVDREMSDESLEGTGGGTVSAEVQEIVEYSSCNHSRRDMF